MFVAKDKHLIIFEDNEILIVNKPVGISTQSDADSGESLLEILSKERNIFLVNRLDKRVSGLVIFAKTEKSQKILNSQIATRSIQKFYKAIVKNQPSEQEATLTHWLLKDAKTKKSKANSKEVKHSKKAELKYKVLNHSEKYYLLDIELFTGRFHQIRCQLSAIDCPILGDLKYGFKRSSPDGSIFLHSYKIRLQHPTENRILEFEIPTPIIWKKYGF